MSVTLPNDSNISAKLDTESFIPPTIVLNDFNAPPVIIVFIAAKIALKFILDIFDATELNTSPIPPNTLLKPPPTVEKALEKSTLDKYLKKL